MSFEKAFETLKQSKTALFDAPTGDVDVGILEQTLGFNLPKEHLIFLSERGGVNVGDGFFRLYGLNSTDHTNLLDWNKLGKWKFSWKGAMGKGLADDYFCFGGTVWGDQYAYLLSDLQSGHEAPVYFLENTQMQAQKIADNFSNFFSGEFIRRAGKAFDGLTIGAVEKFGGRIDTKDMLVFIPPEVLGGERVIETMEKIEAVKGMIAYGDLYTQVREIPDGSVIEGIQNYLDDKGRERLRVVWSVDQEAGEA